MGFPRSAVLKLAHASLFFPEQQLIWFRPQRECAVLMTPWSLGGVNVQTEGDELLMQLNAEQSSPRAVSQYPSPWH